MNDETMNWPELDFPNQEALTEVDEAWLDRIAEEPWVAGLKDVVEPTGRRVGSEDEWMEELKAREGKISKSANSLSESNKPEEHVVTASEVFRLAYGVFPRLGLNIVDYRSILAEQVTYGFDVPEWGWAKSILVYRGDCARRDYYLRAVDHPDPLPLNLLLVAARQRSGAYKRWTGTTPELIRAMLTEGAGSDDEEYVRLFGSNNSQAYAAFHKRMRECKPFLEDIGVRVRTIACSDESATAAEDGKARGNLERTRWIVEVPAWKHKEGFID